MLLALAIGLSVLGACASPPEPGAPAVEDDGPALRSLAAERGLEIGTAVTTSGFGDPGYVTLAGRHFSLAIPEIGGYMVDIRPTPWTWSFNRLDSIVEFAQDHDQKVRGHTLVFGVPSGHDMFGGWTPTPQWVHQKDMSRAEAIGVMQEYIETVMRRYAGKIDEWIVVNEPLGSLFGARRVGGLLLSPNIWLQRIGPDYIRLAFEHARRVDPNARLILNEWGADYIGQDYNRYDRVQEYYDLVVHLLEQGTPIDGVGFQFHLEVGLDTPSVSEIVRNFERYRALGLSTHITELDVRIRKPATQGALRRQADLFGTVIRAALESPSTRDVALWGFTDRYSWITSGPSFPDHAAGTILARDLRVYPSFQSIRAELAAPGR